MRNTVSKFKRGLSLLLSLVLCLSLVTPVAYAEDEHDHDHGDDYGISTLEASNDPKTCTHPNTYQLFLLDICRNCNAWRWHILGWTDDWHTDGSAPGSGEKPKPGTGCEHENTTTTGQITATCQKEGYTGDTYCLDCNETIESGKTIEKAGHTSGTAVREDETNATCSQPGSYDEVVYCSVCGEELSREEKTILATENHSWGEWETVTEATCTEKGSEKRVCSVCNAEETQDIATVEDHTWDDGEVTKAATCTEEGVKTYTCTECGATKTEVIPTTGHNLTQHVKFVPICRCESYGKEAYFECKICGKLYKDRDCTIETTEDEVLIPATGHKLIYHEAKDATCTTDGNIEYWTCSCRQCNSCKYKYFTDEAGTKTMPSSKVVIKATGHTLTEVEAKAATCTEAGNIQYWVCDKCDWKFSDKNGTKRIKAVATSALGHKYGTPTWSWSITNDNTTVTLRSVTAAFKCVNAGCSHEKLLSWAENTSPDMAKPNATVVPATCTTNGSVTFTASVTFNSKTYTDSYTVETKTLEHDFTGEWVSNGETGHHHVCLRDGCTVTDTAAAHTYGGWAYTEGNPNEAYRTCSVCGYEQTMEITITETPDPEVWEDAGITKAASCTETGIHTYRHKDTGLTKEVVIPALGHDWSAEWSTDETQHWHVCTRCDVKQGTSIANHKYTWKVTLAPTAETAGNATGACVCGKTVEASVPALSDGDEWTLTNQAEPTCVTNGYKVYVSASFGTQTQIIPALGHDYADVVVKDASCTEKGIMSHACQRDGCDASESDTEIPMIPHDLEWVEEVPATCEDTGVSGHYKCAVCEALSFNGGTAFEAVEEEALVIPATGHVYGEWTVVTAPTAEVAGTAERVCANDENHVEEMVLPMLPANPGETVEPTNPEEGMWTLSATVDPTCTADGYYEYTHSVTELTARVARTALGHSYSTAWTASADNHWHACTRCGAVADTAAHTWNGGVVTRYATYTSTGERTYTCTVCASIRTETIPMLTYTPDPVIPVTPAGPSNGGNAGNGSNGEIDINENEVPLGSGEDIGGEIDIVDNEIPLASGLNLDRVAYLAGYEDGTVRPSNLITRAEVATVFYRLMSDLTRELNQADTNSFTDVEQDKWFNKAVSTAAKAGILRGYGDSSFKPNNNITRAEFATIASRFLSVDVESAAVFTDVSGHWAEEAIGIVAGAGWIKGYEDGTFRPDETISRVEAAVIINRMLGRDIADRENDTRSWTDNPLTAWFYQDIQEATNGILLR